MSQNVIVAAAAAGAGTGAAGSNVAGGGGGVVGGENSPLMLTNNSQLPSARRLNIDLVGGESSSALTRICNSGSAGGVSGVGGVNANDANDGGNVGNVVGVTATNRCNDSEWMAYESQRQREVDEARARAAQMEKTMKWWSDCTANWREKWNKVRNERNSAREENKQLRINLDLALKEVGIFKREKKELEQQIAKLKMEMEKVHNLMMRQATKSNEIGSNDEDVTSYHLSSIQKNFNKEDGLVPKMLNGMKNLEIEELLLKGGGQQHQVPTTLNDIDNNDDKRLLSTTTTTTTPGSFDDQFLLQKITILQQRLDEAQKTLQIEKEENLILQKNNDKLLCEFQEVCDRQEELRAAKQEAVRELLTLQEQHRAEMRILNNSFQDEVTARENLERRIEEQLLELERRQAENSTEWAKRERLETEKLELERENKKLRNELRDIQKLSDCKRCHHKLTQSSNDAEDHFLQQELSDRNKEISEIKLSYSKLKKLLSETNTDLGHAVRRAEQYESEVKRLRQRVEELKRELAGAEDKLDTAMNRVRHLQRTNDDLIGRTEGLHVQQVQQQQQQARCDS